MQTLAYDGTALIRVMSILALLIMYDVDLNLFCRAFRVIKDGVMGNSSLVTNKTSDS